MSEPQVLYDGRDFRGAQGRSSEESFNIIPCIHVYIIYMIYNTFDVCWGGGVQPQKNPKDPNPK